MPWRLNVMLLALAAGASSAQGADPLKSPECVLALDALQAQETAMRSARTPEAVRPAGAAEIAALQPYRKRVALECLGKEDPAPARTARPPVAVAPVTLPPSAVPVRPAALPPPVALPPLRTVTQCDPSGCWTSDGIRLHRQGPLLVGPPGACTVQSGVLSCR
jgi:hypothetical protein